jgi:DNA-binding transcriptional LysR family regulator
MNTSIASDLRGGQTLKIHEVEAFRAVMIRGTATDAAVLMHTSQPVISKLIARFQRHIGIKLFELHKSRLVPTPEARILFNTIERTYVGMEHIAQTIAELRGGHSGKLIVGSQPSFGMGPLASIATAFLKERPGIQIQIETVTSGLIRHSVISGKADMGIAERSIDVTGVNAEPLIQVNTVCVMNKDHSLAGKRAIKAKDLEGVAMILPSRDSASLASISGMFAQEQVQPEVVVETGYGMNMCVLALQGAGVALVSPFAALPLRRAGLVVKRFEPNLPIELMLMTAADAPPSRIAAMFIERLHDAMAPLRETWG